MTDQISAWVNGAPGEYLGVTDRGLQFGDGLFETIAVRGGRPIWLDKHLDRLISGCQRLQFRSIPDSETLREEALRFCTGHREAVLKLIVTRGSSTEGYSTLNLADPNRIMILKEAPRHSEEHAHDGIHVGISSQRISLNPSLAGLKHLNRLEQVLARIECETRWQECIMLDDEGHVVEGTMSNLFLVRDDILVTPSLEHAGIDGITRNEILEIAEKISVPCEVRDIQSDELNRFDEIFVCNSLIGIWPVVKMEDRRMDIGDMTRKLQVLLAEAMC